ncbi:hypothetical protein C789_906 [Microcystis aeruginosa FACHB-905 = DIANCHI905]|nr:hypothetical protein C789_906 [Microcystis aeruginosa FACHB-905 = DIANCHI905]
MIVCGKVNCFCRAICLFPILANLASLLTIFNKKNQQKTAI